MLEYLLNYMKTCHYLHDNESCDEVAERALKELEQGYMLTIHGEGHIPGECWSGVPIKLPVDEGYREFFYHTVVCIGRGYILDPLLYQTYGSVIEYEEYFDMIARLNPGMQINVYDGEVNY